MIIERESQLDGVKRSMDLNVTIDQMNEFYSPNRRHIQDIFPNLSAPEREFILTGITPEQWEQTFGSLDDDDDTDNDTKGVFDEPF